MLRGKYARRDRTNLRRRQRLRQANPRANRRAQKQCTPFNFQGTRDDGTDIVFTSMKHERVKALLPTLEPTPAFTSNPCEG